MKLYTKTKVIRISETQHKTLIKMKLYNVDVGRFIRDAIPEKIKKEYSELIPKLKKQLADLLITDTVEQKVSEFRKSETDRIKSENDRFGYR